MYYLTENDIPIKFRDIIVTLPNNEEYMAFISYDIKCYVYFNTILILIIPFEGIVSWEYATQLGDK